MQKTILCTDGHMSYKGFAIDQKLEHNVLKAILKQYLQSYLNWFRVKKKYKEVDIIEKNDRQHPLNN